jgi:hypothetical protein
MPPINACDELEGMPKNHVTRFHAMPPMRPAKTTVNVIAPGSTMPSAIVAATASDRNAPAKFRAAEIATAILGRSAPVAIDVAIAFAESWKPFVKSKASAVATTVMSSRVFASIAWSSFSGGRVVTPSTGPPNAHPAGGLFTRRSPVAQSRRLQTLRQHLSATCWPDAPVCCSCFRSNRRDGRWRRRNRVEKASRERAPGDTPSEHAMIHR